jgi:hypothetical protein
MTNIEKNDHLQSLLDEYVKVYVDHDEGEPDHIVGVLSALTDDYAIIDVHAANNYQGVTAVDENGASLQSWYIAVDPDLVAPASWYVTAYELNQEYGGPEEGGWWYTTETVVDVAGPFVSQLAAKQAADRWAERYPRTHQYTSVIYSGGDYSIRIAPRPGKNSPEERPRYE